MLALVEYEHEGVARSYWTESWAGSEALAQKAAATLRAQRRFAPTDYPGWVKRTPGTRMRGPRATGPLVHSQVVVVPVPQPEGN